MSWMGENAAPFFLEISLICEEAQRAILPPCDAFLLPLASFGNSSLKLSSQLGYSYNVWSAIGLRQAEQGDLT